MDYRTLMKMLKDFETGLKGVRLKTDEVAELCDQVCWLEETLTEMDSDD